jgi:hypothetical protein
MVFSISFAAAPRCPITRSFSTFATRSGDRGQLPAGVGCRMTLHARRLAIDAVSRSVLIEASEEQATLHRRENDWSVQFPRSARDVRKRKSWRDAPF